MSASDRAVDAAGIFRTDDWPRLTQPGSARTARAAGTPLFLGIDIGTFVALGNEEDARALIDELGITFPNGTISDVMLLNFYNVIGVPTTVFIRPDGEITAQRNGAVTETEIRAYVNELIAASN